VVEVEVQAPHDVAQVELLVDGRVVDSRTEPPWRFTVDVGQDNVEHRFEVYAYDPDGAMGRSEVTTPRIRIDEELRVELQQLYVTASHDVGRVLDLGQADFRVLDNGVEQKLITFGRGDLPITAVLLLDASESMRGERFQAALRGAEAFGSEMRKLDEASLLLFSDQLLRATPFTNDTGELLAPLAGVEPGGNTAINDHLYLALKLLDARQGRRVVVLFSDGADLHSVLGMDEVLWKARRSQALVYWIRFEERGVSSSFATAWRDVEGNKRELAELEQAVGASGGRIVGVSSVGEVEPAFREILRELREQYVLGYYPSDSRDDGSWHKVEVGVRRSGVEVRVREGYVDF
ncbi:MAG: VWA domain-containing protein, partial [Thermoanaerobaculia bacterium]|nr:VWA domain-containing protein [Thermoanaerobaculia bacterium]